MPASSSKKWATLCVPSCALATPTNGGAFNAIVVGPRPASLPGRPTVEPRSTTQLANTNAAANLIQRRFDFMASSFGALTGMKLCVLTAMVGTMRDYTRIIVQTMRKSKL
jgi:hypothetical protein